MQIVHYHIFPRFDGTWLSKRDNVNSVSVRARTLEEAIVRTVRIARRWHGTVLVHYPDGRIVDVPMAA